MKKTLTIMLAVALCAVPVAAQSAAVARAQSEFAAAKAAKERDQAEICALHLRRARVALADATVVPEDLQKSIDEYARRFDPRDANRTKALRKAARQLAGVARKYIDAKWLTLASNLVRETKSLDAATAKPLIEALAKARVDTPTSGALAEMFGDGERIWGTDEWRFDGDTLRTPPYDKSRYLMIGAQRLDFAADGRSTELEFRAEDSHEIAIVFAFRHIEEYAALRLRSLDDGRVTVTLLRMLDNKETVLTQIETKWSEAELAGWRRVEIESADGELRASLGDRDPLVTPMPKALTLGFLGLMVAGENDEHEPVVFRGLTMRGFE